MVEEQTEAGGPLVSIQRMDSEDVKEDQGQNVGDEDASPRVYATEEERYEAYLEFQ